LKSKTSAICFEEQVDPRWNLKLTCPAVSDFCFSKADLITFLTEQILKSTMTKSKWKVGINNNENSNFCGKQKLHSFIIGLAVIETNTKLWTF